MKASDILSSIGLMAKSLVKIAAYSRKTNLKCSADASGNSIIVLGNGPSLADTIRDVHGSEFCGKRARIRTPQTKVLHYGRPPFLQPY